MLTGLILLACVAAGLAGIFVTLYADGRPVRVRRRARSRGRPGDRPAQHGSLHPGLRRR